MNFSNSARQKALAGPLFLLLLMGNIAQGKNGPTPIVPMLFPEFFVVGLNNNPVDLCLKPTVNTNVVAETWENFYETDAVNYGSHISIPGESMKAVCSKPDSLRPGCVALRGLVQQPHPSNFIISKLHVYEL